MPALRLYREHVGAESLGAVWALTKATRTVVCTVSTHVLGWELVTRVDGELFQSEVCKDEMPAFATSDAWRAAWAAKSWTTPFHLEDIAGSL